MADEVEELPEAKDPFERRIAMTVAVLAVVSAVVGMLGDNAKVEGIQSTTRAANQWAYYQAKSIKEHGFTLSRDLLGALAPGAVDEGKRADLVARYAEQAKAYSQDKEKIKAEAEALETEAARSNHVNDRCDLAELQLHIAIVIASIGILVRWNLLWYVALALGVSGLVTAVTAFAR